MYGVTMPKISCSDGVPIQQRAPVAAATDEICRANSHSVAQSSSQVHSTLGQWLRTCASATDLEVASVASLAPSETSIARLNPAPQGTCSSTHADTPKRMSEPFMTYKRFRQRACQSLTSQKTPQIWPEDHFSADWKQEVCGTGHDTGTGLKAIPQLPIEPVKSPCIKPRGARSEDKVQWTPRSCRVHQASDGMHATLFAQAFMQSSRRSCKVSLTVCTENHLCTSCGTSQTHCKPPDVRLHITCMLEGPKCTLVLMQTEPAQGPARPVCQGRKPGCPSGRRVWRLCSRRTCRRWLSSGASSRPTSPVSTFIRMRCCGCSPLIKAPEAIMPLLLVLWPIVE